MICERGELDNKGEEDEPGVNDGAARERDGVDVVGTNAGAREEGEEERACSD